MFKKIYINFKSILFDKKNRKNLILFLFVLFLIIYLATFASPKITLIAQIQNVTDMDYNMFIDINDEIPLEKKTRDNCRFISVSIKVVNPILLVRDVKFDNLTLQKYLFDTQYFNNTINEIKFLGQYSSPSNNEFSEGIDVYMEGMTNEKLKEFFGDDKITVTWVDLFNRKHKQILYLKDYFL